MQFHCGSDPADGHVAPVVVVNPVPSLGQILSLLYRFKVVLIPPIVPHGAIVALDLRFLLGLSGLDIFDGHAAFLGPFHQ